MNRVSAKSLLHSKWTKLEVVRKEKHFMITEVNYDETGKVERCVIQAVINKSEYEIDWRSLKDSECWRIGWK